jgi:hypothetical protein
MAQKAFLLLVSFRGMISDGVNDSKYKINILKNQSIE